MTDAISSREDSRVSIPVAPAKDNEAVQTALFNKTHISQEKSRTLFNESRMAAEKVLAVMSSDKETKTSSLVNSAAPELKVPQVLSAVTDIKLNSSAMFTLLIGNIRSLLNEHSLKQLTNRLEMMQAQSLSIKQAGEALALQFQQALDQSAAAIAAADADLELLHLADAQLAEKQRDFEQAKNALSLLSPEDPEYASAQNRLETAEKALGEAEMTRELAEGKAMASYQAAYDATAELDELLDRLKGIANVSSPVIEDMQDQLRNSMAIMILLISSLMKLVSETNAKKLETDQEYFQRVQESEMQAQKLNADKHDEQVRKQAALNTAMGCIGKILGGLITLFSVVGALFTGGASLAFAAVGLALMAGDAIGKAITGVSFMEKALSPLMENIIKPLMDLVSKGITKMLERLGVDTATANMIGGIIGTLVTAALVIAVVIVGRAAAGKVAATAIGNMIKEALKDLLPALLKNALKSANAMVSNAVKRVLEKCGLATDKEALRLYTNRLSKTAISTELGSETIQSAGRVAGGAITNNMQKLLASFTMSSENIKQINEMLQSLMDEFSKSSQQVQQLMAILTAGLNKNGMTANSILKNSIA